MGSSGRSGAGGRGTPEQGVNRVKAEWTYASNNLHRIEPLLAKQFVTADQVDRAKTSEIAQAEALSRRPHNCKLSQAGLKSALAQYQRSKAAWIRARRNTNNRSMP